MPPSSTFAAASFRPPNHSSAVAQQQSSALAARIASKKAELENLRQLRDMSCALAEQMQALEIKIGTLRDGTEGMFPGQYIRLAAAESLRSLLLAVACVLANWDNVLRAISMASGEHFAYSPRVSVVVDAFC